MLLVLSFLLREWKRENKKATYRVAEGKTLTV